MSTDATSVRLPRIVVAAGLLLVVNMGLLAWTSPSLPKSLECVFTSPILCAELPTNGAALRGFLAAEKTPLETWWWQVVLDYPFLVLYGLLLALGGWFRGRQHPKAGLRKGVVLLIALGATADVLENTGLLLAIANVADGLAIDDSLAAFIRTCAVAKFSLLCAGAALGCAFFLLDKQDAPVRGRFQATFAICLCGLVLVAPFDIRFLEYAFVGIVFACLIFFIYALAHVVKGRIEPSDATSA